MTAWLLLLACPQPTGDSGTTPPGDSATETGTTDTDTGSTTTVPATGCLLPRTAWEGEVCVERAPCTLTGGGSYEYFGTDLDARGDGNGDGVGDLLVGAPGRDSADGTRDAGRARIWSGAGLAETGEEAVLGHLYGTWEYENLGHAVSWVGDMTGDGVDDFVATSRSYDTHLEAVGRVALVAGEAGGWLGWDLTPTATWVGATEYARAGHQVQPVGDTDGDGLADLAITTDLRTHNGSSEAYSGGGVALILGAAELSAWDAPLSDAAGHLTPEDTSGAAGLALTAGDFDGDGAADVALSAPYSSSYGKVYAVPGAGLAGTTALADAPVRWSGDESYAVFGWKLAAGDLDGDGFDELIVAAPLSDQPLEEAGRVLVYAGGAAFFDGEATLLANLEGDWDHQELGTGLATGDVDADGVDDLVLGAVTAWKGLVTKGGRVEVFLGQAGGWAPGEAAVTLYGAGSKDYLGGVLEVADLDGDGAAELLLGTAYANPTGTDAGAVYLLGGML